MQEAFSVYTVFPNTFCLKLWKQGWYSSIRRKAANRTWSGIACCHILWQGRETSKAGVTLAPPDTHSCRDAPTWALRPWTINILAAFSPIKSSYNLKYMVLGYQEQARVAVFFPLPSCWCRILITPGPYIGLSVIAVRRPAHGLTEESRHQQPAFTFPGSLSQAADFSFLSRDHWYGRTFNTTNNKSLRSRLISAFYHEIMGI